MEAAVPDIFILNGPLAGRRFSGSAATLRLGRSSSCEIAIPDPALSRNHCLFEFRDNTWFLTDLASANGTFVNDEPLDAHTRQLKPGDLITAGASRLTLAAPDETPVPPLPTIDLGFAHDADTPPPPTHAPWLRPVLWTVAVLAAAASAILILTTPQREPVAPAALPPPGHATLHAFTFEKVEANPRDIYRYALAYTAATGILSVEIDDVPDRNRHIRKSITLTADARTHLTALLAHPRLRQLDSAYTGVAQESGTLTRFALRVLANGNVTETVVENTQEPDVFSDIRQKLETFSKNELGIWAIQYPVEKLIALSAESRRTGDAKWDERDVQHGNLAAALAAYDEAIFYLDTVNPKPADYGRLVQRRHETSAELNRRYRDQRFLADRALNLTDWETARRELRILCELIPDAKDPRHAEATAKLLDVETRLKNK
jgi:pSer/pThr/pTyr-binding forkhead associated (FHA) protein